MVSGQAQVLHFFDVIGGGAAAAADEGCAVGEPFFGLLSERIAGGFSVPGVGGGVVHFA